MIYFGSGVGGATESFDSALVKGKNFVQFDNVRGSINSQKFETFMSEDSYQARPAYNLSLSKMGATFAMLEPFPLVIICLTNYLRFASGGIGGFAS